MKKCIIILFLVLLVGYFVPRNVFATDDIDGIVTDMASVGKVTGAGTSQIGKIINGVIKLIQVAGSGISVIVVTMLGVKYMMASAGEKADIKKQAVPIIIGCVLLFAGSNIAGLIADLGVSLNSSSTEAQQSSRTTQTQSGVGINPDF